MYNNETTIKAQERLARGMHHVNLASISHKQKLLEDMALFWNSASNKILIQEYFVDWMIEAKCYNQTIYVGGIEDGKCKKLSPNQDMILVPELYSNKHEEADDRIMMHISHAGHIGIKSVLVFSADTDVFVGLSYHYLSSFNIEELHVIIGGSKHMQKTVPIHLLVRQLNPVLISCLPAIHALTGCDTTSKVGTKAAIMKKSVDLELIRSFGKTDLSISVLENAEQFLLQMIGKGDFRTFDRLRYHQYYDAEKNLTLMNIVCCSSTIRLHIKRAFLQTFLWISADKSDRAQINPMLYGYKTDHDGFPKPVLVEAPIRPLDLPNPCTCKVCAKSTCCCRVENIKCVLYCGCDQSNCRNPNNC